MEFVWDGIVSAYKVGRLIGMKRPFSVLINGAAAAALRRVAAPGVKLDREMLRMFVANFSLTTLPGLMLYALGRHYHLSYENLGEEGVRMRFLTE